eukprot:COSAG02_NODE_2033_length_10056_cov_31.055539_4_plen_419_part_00
MQLKIDALDAEEAEIRRRLASGLLTAKEEEGLRQRLAAIDQNRIQLNTTKLNLQKSELQRRFASGSLSPEEEEEITEQLTTINSKLIQLQAKALSKVETELQRRLSSGMLSFEEESKLRKRLAQMNAENSQFSIDAAGVEAEELRRQLGDDNQRMSREQDADEKRLASLEQQVDHMEIQKLHAQHSRRSPGELRSEIGLTDHSWSTECAHGGATSSCEFEDETRMFVSLLQGTHSPLRPVSPLQPRASTSNANRSKFGTPGLAQEMDDMLREWKRIRTSVRHGTRQTLTLIHVGVHTSTGSLVCLSGCQHCVLLKGKVWSSLVWLVGGTGKSRWMVDKTVRHAVGARIDSDASWSTMSLPTLGRSQEPAVRRQRGQRRPAQRSQSVVGHGRPEKTSKSRGRGRADLPVLRMIASQRKF